MTKYVLNSGGINEPTLKKLFHREIIKGLGNSPRFLLCNFAQGREYWEAKFQDYSNAIREDMPEDTEPTFDLAMPDTFIAQCEEADVIFFHGGDDHLLTYWMDQFKLSEIFKDKVVATNSASSNMLAAHYWTCDWRKCMDGLKVLPIKFIPHFESSFGEDDPRGPIDWQSAHKDLAAYGDTSLPIYTPKEGEFIVLEQ